MLFQAHKIVGAAIWFLVLHLKITEHMGTAQNEYSRVTTRALTALLRVCLRE
jgi:hypothetical protein